MKLCSELGRDAALRRPASQPCQFVAARGLAHALPSKKSAPICAYPRLKIGKVMQGKARVFDPPRGGSPNLPLISTGKGQKNLCFQSFNALSNHSFIPFFTPKNMQFYPKNQ
jgi:hypothetical protein